MDRIAARIAYLEDALARYEKIPNAEGAIEESATVKLPAKHALDWLDRCGGDLGAELVVQTERTVTLSLPPAALRDLLEDCRHYAECMGPADTGDIDYRPAARRCLAALQRAGAAA
jgi:hypothetical protein